MFDMGFTEMMLIGIVALVVIGPERLPGVARTAGKYIGRLKRFMTTVKADVEQELRADELREILSQQQKELDSLKDTISEAGMEIEKEADVVGAATDSGSGASTADGGQQADADKATAKTAGDTPAQPDKGDSARADEPARKAGS